MTLKTELDTFRSSFMTKAPPEVREAMTCADMKKNGDDSWVLPIPVTNVIDTNGTIVLAFVDVDYRNRLEPAEIISALGCLRRERCLASARA
jgi:peroxiredoxin